MKKQFQEVFDVVFIMLLCFTTLLTTMLTRGKVIVGSGSAGGLAYTFGISSFVITMGFFVLCIAYIVKKSDKELRQMIAGAYDKAVIDKYLKGAE